jgi:hypothetical protein
MRARRMSRSYATSIRRVLPSVYYIFASIWGHKVGEGHESKQNEQELCY